MTTCLLPGSLTSESQVLYILLLSTLFRLPAKLHPCSRISVALMQSSEALAVFPGYPRAMAPSPQAGSLALQSETQTQEV